MAQISPIQATPCPPCQRISPQPNYNAVKISINNPQVNVAGPQTNNTQTPQDQITAAPVYTSVPSASLYDMPQRSVYQSETPVVPPPVIVQPTINQVSEPAQVIPTVTPSPAPAPAPAPAAAPQKVEVNASEETKPQVDLNEFISKLTSADYDVQAKAMASIAEMVEASPQKATELLDVKVIDALLNIINKDSSKLAGPTPKQLQIREKIISGKKVTDAEAAEANKISPMELAERNKLYAILTIATLQKLYGSEIEKMSKTVVPMTELPGAAVIVEQLKGNPNPMVKVVSLEALSYIARPEYKQDLKTLFSVVKNDKDPYVQKAAEAAMKKLEQVVNPSASTETQKAA